MTLRVVPEGLTAAGAAVEALTARLTAAHAAAAPAVTAVIPPAADPVSLQTAISLSAHGAEHQALATQGITELGRAGSGVTETGISYATGDTQAAATYVTVLG